MLRKLFYILALWLFIVGQSYSVDMASESSEYDDTAQVLQALSGLRDTTKKATEVAQEAINSLKSDDLKNNDQVKERFTIIITGVQEELKKLQSGSELDHAISDLIGLADYQIDELQRLGDEYDDLIKGWKSLRSDLKAISLEIKENRELLYSQLTQLVEKEQFIVQLLKLRIAKKAVSELKKVVESLNKVRVNLTKWTENAENTITRKEGEGENSTAAGKSPQ